MTAISRVYDGGLVAALTGGTLATGIAGEALTFAGQTGAFADKNVGTGIAVTVTETTLGNGAGGLASNYSLTQPIVPAANISAKALAITLPADRQPTAYTPTNPALRFTTDTRRTDPLLIEYSGPFFQQNTNSHQRPSTYRYLGEYPYSGQTQSERSLNKPVVGLNNKGIRSRLKASRASQEMVKSYDIK